MELVDINIQSLFWNVIVCALGFLAHILKKVGVEQVGFKEYLTANQSRTMGSLSTVIGAFVGLLVLHPDASALEFFALGFMSDSLANRTPSDKEIEAVRNKRL